MGKRCMCLVLALLVFGLASNASANLAAHWKLDETSGSVAADSSGNGFDGTVGGTPNWVPGQVDGALDLDGATNYIDVNTEVIRGTCSVALWIMPRNLPYSSDYRAILHVDEWNSGSLHGHLRNTTSLFNFDINGGGAVTSTTVAQPDEWYHLAGTFDTEIAESKIYVNGVMEATAAGLNPALYVGPLNWGAWTDSQRYFDGIMDDIRIYSRALSEGNIQDIVNGVPLSFTKAEAPKPADGEMAVTMPLLQWSKGETAMFHDIYLGTSPELTEADQVSARQPFTMYYSVTGFEPGVTYYWRVDEVEADMATVHTGNVWSFTTQALTAYYPNPTDGAVDAAAAPTLTWLPGQMAAKHQVYFGADMDAVTQGTAETDKGEVEEATFAPGDLDSVATYYWRVDEVLASGEVKTGPVWSFTTVLPVDDFESYTDDEGSRIYETWIDGWTNGTGSTVGNIDAPFAEQTITHEGSLQSMPIDYNNVNSPFYSEAEIEFSPARDWTTGGVETLVLYVRGRPTNGATQMYVEIVDSSNGTGVSVHADTAIVTTAEWTAWKITLSEFTDVNLSRVAKMVIGLGDKANPAAGGAGRVYVDDIQVTKPE